MINKKPKKSIFIHGPLDILNRNEEMYCRKIKDILHNKSMYENIGYVPGSVSNDGKERSLILSRKIIKKIQFDHGKICPENIIINTHRWDYIVSYPYNNIDKIIIIKQIKDCHNYLVIAANRNNGFYMVTHFEVESIDDKNLKRRLKRGNVLSRGPSICL